jgi:hypothetical protein
MATRPTVLGDLKSATPELKSDTNAIVMEDLQFSIPGK